MKPPPTGTAPVRWFDEIDSTNAEARRLAEAGEAGPLWLAARRQTAGRGRRGNAWDAGHANLAATLLVAMDLEPAKAAELSFVAALAVRDLACDYVPDSLVRLKWPNDLLLAGGKLSGILLESGRRDGGGLWLAIGIGVNLASFPGGTERPATSLAAHLKDGVAAPPSPQQALERLSAALAGRIAAWRQSGFEPVRAQWLEAAVGLGQRCMARLGRETVIGVAEGLDLDGALLLRLEDGALRRITAGDVFFGGRLMLLAIEQGNTNTKFAVHDGQGWAAQWRTSTEASRTADEYAVWLNQLLQMQELKLADLDACIIATVVPQSLFNLRNLARRYLKVEPLVIGENAELGFEVRIDKPSEAGADRLVTAAGAHALYPGALVVVGSGTATTFDVVAEDGGLEGCAIAPGINLSMEALHAAAAKLPRVAIRRPAHVIGRDTVESMQAGVYWGYVALIEGLVDRIKAEFGRPMTVIATGGVASLFHGASDKIDVFDPDITIRGLLEIYRRNVAAKAPV